MSDAKRIKDAIRRIVEIAAEHRSFGGHKAVMEAIAEIDDASDRLAIAASSVSTPPTDAPRCGVFSPYMPSLPCVLPQGHTGNHSSSPPVSPEPSRPTDTERLDWLEETQALVRTARVGGNFGWLVASDLSHGEQAFTPAPASLRTAIDAARRAAPSPTDSHAPRCKCPLRRDYAHESYCPLFNGPTDSPAPDHD